MIAALRRVCVIGGTPDSHGRHPCKLQWYDEENAGWEDFDPCITGWAVECNNETLPVGTRLPGLLADVSRPDGLPVFAVFKADLVGV